MSAFDEIPCFQASARRRTFILCIGNLFPFVLVPTQSPSSTLPPTACVLKTLFFAAYKNVEPHFYSHQWRILCTKTITLTFTGQPLAFFKERLPMEKELTERLAGITGEDTDTIDQLGFEVNVFRPEHFTPDEEEMFNLLMMSDESEPWNFHFNFNPY
jgi:hypothetical protein